MGVKLKITGLTEARRHLKKVQEDTEDSIRKLENEKIELIIGGIQLKADVKDDKVMNFLRELPQIIKAAHNSVMKQMAELLRTALNEAMESPVWDWKSDTRDIIDTGALRDSLNLYTDSDGDIHIMYGEDYAGIVHYGGYFHPYGNKLIKQYYPGRPWVTAVLEGDGPVDKFDFEVEYKRLMEIELESRLGSA